jgi:hypothetical protein
LYEFTGWGRGVTPQFAKRLSVSDPKPETPASALTPRDRWDWLLETPWGVLVFLLLVVVGGFVWTLVSGELQAGDYLTAVGGGAGLLAVGHGVRAHGKRHNP